MYDRNRYYDPVGGRFTQEDPAGLAGGVNLYGYAGGDPANSSDPFGLFDCDRDHPADCSLKDVALNFLAGLGAVASGDVADRGPGWKTGAALGEIGLLLGVEAPVGQGAAAGAGAVVTTEVATRPTLGADGATSMHEFEIVGGRTNSVTHKVELDGKVIHQHTEHVGKYGTTRRFPDEWTGKKTIDQKKIP